MTDPAPFLLIVRRGATDRFRYLAEAFADDPVEVRWDRRHGERRQGGCAPMMGERRAGERRRPPPLSWSALDIVVVEGADPGGWSGLGG